VLQFAYDAWSGLRLLFTSTVNGRACGFIGALFGIEGGSPRLEAANSLSVSRAVVHGLVRFALTPRKHGEKSPHTVVGLRIVRDAKGRGAEEPMTVAQNSDGTWAVIDDEGSVLVSGLTTHAAVQRWLDRQDRQAATPGGAKGG
jgi:hypothetical protein